MCLEVRYGLNDRDIHTGSCVNLCSGGMFIETRQPLPLEQLLHVDFLLPGTTRVIASPASIAWINTEQDPVNKNLPPGMGLQFLSLNLNDLLAICRYIRLRTE
jgi:Tfp pilus assembly protein PilZ